MANTLNLKRPDVYIQEISKFPPSVAQVATAIPAFIGFTEKAKRGITDLTLEPTKITSLLEYEEFFGGAQPEKNLIAQVDDTVNGEDVIVNQTVVMKFDPTKARSKHNMYYSLQMYFANGGGPCYIVSIGGYLDTFGAAIPLEYDGPNGKKMGFKQALDVLRKEDEPTLLCAPESQAMLLDNYGVLLTQMIDLCVEMQDRFMVGDIHDDGSTLQTAGDVDDKIQASRDKLPNEKDRLKYGALYFPNLKSTFDYATDFNSITIEHNKIKINSDAAAEKGKFDGKTIGELQSAAAQADRLPDSLRAKIVLGLDALNINLPPSPAMAGIYARVDNSRGVWKAPANVSVSAISGLTFKVTDLIHENLNVDVNGGKSVNAIRSFTGRGTLVWGSRTLAGNDNEWRYIPVRRFFNMVEESVKKATYQFVFEPNDANTWSKVQAMIENFLLLQWRAGALAGAVSRRCLLCKCRLG